MGKNKILTKPAKLSEISFDELYDSFSTDWERKAEKLRLRRWRHIKQKIV